MMTEHGSSVDYFECLCSTYQAASAERAPIIRSVSVAGVTVRLSFHSPELSNSLSRALSHLEPAETSTPSLTIHIGDGRSGRLDVPEPSVVPWRTASTRSVDQYENYLQLGERISTFFSQGEDWRTFSVLDSQKSLAVYWISDAERIPYWETARPLFTLLYWCLRRHGLQVTHGGAVGTTDGGVLIGGRSNSGKSSTCLACVNRGLLYAGDDYIVLSAKPAYVHSIYSSGKVDKDGIERLSHLAPYVVNSNRLDTEKGIVFLQDHFPGKIARGFPLRAILFPRIAGLCTPRLSKISAALGLRLLAPSTLVQLPGSSKTDFQLIADVVSQVPSYTLELSKDMSLVPSLILDLLDKGRFD